MEESRYDLEQIAFALRQAASVHSFPRSALR